MLLFRTTPASRAQRMRKLDSVRAAGGSKSHVAPRFEAGSLASRQSHSCTREVGGECSPHPQPSTAPFPHSPSHRSLRTDARAHSQRHTLSPISLAPRDRLPFLCGHSLRRIKTRESYPLLHPDTPSTPSWVSHVRHSPCPYSAHVPRTPSSRPPLAAPALSAETALILRKKQPLGGATPKRCEVHPLLPPFPL